MSVPSRIPPVRSFALFLAVQISAGVAARAWCVEASPAPVAHVITADTCGVEGSCVDVPARPPSVFRAVRMAADGTRAANPTATELCVRGVHPQRAVTVGDGAGGLLVAWIESSDPSAPVRAFRRDAAGAVVAGWPSAGVVLCAADGQRSALRMVSDGAGGAIAAWVDHRDGRRGHVYAQRVTASGAIASGWATHGVAASSDTADEAGLALAGDGSGGAYLAWQRSGPSVTAVRLTRLASDGTRGLGWPDVGLVVCGQDSAQSTALVIGDGANGAIVAWEDGRAGPVPRLYALRFTAAAARVPTWAECGVRVSTTEAAQRFARLAGDAASGIYLVWHEQRSGAGRLYAQRITGAGAIAAGWSGDGLPVSTGSGEQFDCAVAADGTGGLLVGWADYGGGAASDVYLQRLTALGTIASGWPAAGAAVCVGSGDAFHPTPADVDLGATTVAWNEVGEDALVTDAGPPPAPDRNAIQWLTHGFSAGDLLVRFALVSHAPAALELIDVAGRRMVRRQLESPSPGWRTARLDDGVQLAPGVYFVRLTQGGRAAVAKAIVLR